jgi:hypothetical protein
MVTLDRIRLTGLLTKKPRKRGFFYSRSQGERERLAQGGSTFHTGAYLYLTWLQEQFVEAAAGAAPA